ncbi:uncharacterized protein L201_006871 [Kwoniella dendrophila CBS 6074]|uniref:Saccharopine dehydrogenase NADP binding domain-containing protein n=1 Tax=Kwoniella dendrophila CBS 6074 TaxID=1295534 RepID=A0AAX4K3H0_9TREE
MSTSKENRKPTLIIYGATSYTARQLLPYLDLHRDSTQFEFILSGRNKEKLQAANAKLNKPREIAVCQLNDEEAVKDLVAKGDVVVNLAGPFRWHNAEALIRECCKTGKHYVDLCGESSWLASEIIPKYNRLAIQSGSYIVPSCGFDSVPSDLSLYISHKTLQKQYPELSISDSKSFFKLKGGSMSGGTIQSMYSLAELPKDKRRSGEYDCVPEDGNFIKSKSTIPKLSYELEIPNEPKRYGSFFFMYPYNRTIIRRSQYLSSILPSINNNNSNNNGEEVQEQPKYGKKMNYEESWEMGKGKFRSCLFSLTVFLAFGLFFSSNIIRKLFSYILPKAGEGVSDEQLFKASYVVDNLSTSTPLSNGKQVQVLTTFKGQGDPGYLNTCYLLAESALSLALNKDELPLISRKGGLLTPSIAMGNVLVERLNKSGKFEITSKILETSSGKKTE